MSFGQNVYIPDANFKNYLVNNTAINTNGDSEIQVTEASAFTGIINCYDLSISDLIGIEAFTALTYLNCGYNQLTSLDVTQNTALEVLECYSNQLTSLDVSQNTALYRLKCDDNQLTSLDVSNNTALESLDCDANQLTSLDVSQNTALKILGCTVNQLTSLDVSNNTALEVLECAINQLTSLDVSNNTALEGLNCDANQLTSLDVSQNTALIILGCIVNQLTCLNVANGNNINLVVFDAENNPNLTCIQVDDAVWSSANWTGGNIDSQIYFSANCNNACSNTTGINELNATPKQLIKIVDVLGRKTPFKPNTTLLYIYNDGTVERKMIIE
tara:strand:- start:66 stop:1055 length:990 start_codon:yes stop_codon:yes gene_type:complete